MKAKQFKTLGHQITYQVPESSEEFNKLDPKRPDAACDEATNNIVYRSMHPETRYVFLHGREEVLNEDKTVKLPKIVGVEEETGIERKTKPVIDPKTNKPRQKDGEDVTTFDESEEKFYNRVLATLVEQKKFASEDAARAHFQPLIESIASEVPFDVTAAERTERGPKKLAAKYKVAAAKVLAIGNVDAVNANQLKQIEKSFTPTGDTSKMFTGSYEVDGKETSFSVSDKDAEALGWLIKEYLDFKAEQMRKTEGF